MNKGDQVLQALAKTPSLTIDELAEKVDWTKSRTGKTVSSLVTRKLVVGTRVEGGGLAKRYKLAASTAKPQTSAPRTLSAIARKYAPPANDLLHRHVVTTLAQLEAVIGITADEMLATALRSHKEAVELLRGTT